MLHKTPVREQECGCSLHPVLQFVRCLRPINLQYYTEKVLLPIAEYSFVGAAYTTLQVTIFICIKSLHLYGSFHAFIYTVHLLVRNETYPAVAVFTFFFNFCLYSYCFRIRNQTSSCNDSRQNKENDTCTATYQ